MGGSIILPESNEEFQTHLDITSKLILPELHEKCVDASGNIIMWVGYTDEDMEGKSKENNYLLNMCNCRCLGQSIHKGTHAF